MTILSVLLGLGSFRRDAATWLSEALAGSVVIPFAWFGTLIITRRPGNRIGVLLLGIALAMAVSAVAVSGISYGLAHPGLPGFWVLAWVDSWVYVPLSAGLFFLLLLFPTGRPVSARWRPVLWTLAAWSVLTWLVAALAPVIEVEQGRWLDNPIGVPALGAGTLWQLPWLWFGLFPVLLAASGVSLAVRFRRARGAERQQLKWLLAAVAVYLLSWMLWIPAEDAPWINVANAAATWGVPAAIGMAVLRYRLYDIDRIINRTLVYGLLTAVLGLGYAGMVLVLGQLFGGVTSDPPSWAVAGVTLAVAALFQPVRRRIQQTVDRRFNRRRYDAAKRSRRSAPACATRSIWTPSRPSCLPSLTRPWSRVGRHCGFDLPSERRSNNTERRHTGRLHRPTATPQSLR